MRGSSGPYNYFDPAWHPYYHGTEAHSMQSVSKTVTSVLIGIAVTRGDFKAPLSTPVLHYFDEKKVKNLDDAQAAHDRAKPSDHDQRPRLE